MVIMQDKLLEALAQFAIEGILGDRGCAEDALFANFQGAKKWKLIRI